MKIVMLVRSEQLFSLLGEKVLTIPNIPVPEFKLNLTLTELEDSIEFYKPDLYILHSNIEGKETYQKMLQEQNCEYFVFEDDLSELESYIIDKFAPEPSLDPLDSEIDKELQQEKTVYQEKIIQKKIIEKQYESIPSKLIIVGSLTRSSGSTLLATNMARMIAERGVSVSYVEHPLIRPYMFDYLQIHNEEVEYIDLSRQVIKEEMKSLKESSYKKFGVDWHVIDSRIASLNRFEYHHMLMLNHAVDSNIMILDISDRWKDPEIQKIMRLADLVIVAAEPDPIKFEYTVLNYSDLGKNVPTPEYQAMKHLQDNMGNRYEIVLTKQFKGMDSQSLNELFEEFKRPIATLPYIEYPTIMKALYNSKLIYDFNKEMREEIESNLLGIISRFLPKNLVELSGGTKGFIRKIMKK